MGGQRLGGDVLSPHYQQINQADVQEAHKKGLKIIPWTVNNEAQMRRLIDWGVDGIMTDLPDALKNLLVN